MVTLLITLLITTQEPPSIPQEAKGEKDAGAQGHSYSYGSVCLNGTYFGLTGLPAFVL